MSDAAANTGETSALALAHARMLELIERFAAQETVTPLAVLTDFGDAAYGTTALEKSACQPL